MSSTSRERPARRSMFLYFGPIVNHRTLLRQHMITRPSQSFRTRSPPVNVNPIPSPGPAGLDFPNLQETRLGVGWIGGGLTWIPRVLSTPRPATSPHSSTDQLNFDRLSESESEGTVNVSIVRDPGFRVALDALNIIRFHSFPADLRSLK